MVSKMCMKNITCPKKRGFGNQAGIAVETLEELLSVIGKDKQDEIISKEAVAILSNNKLNETDARFLIAVDKIDDAETYLIDCADQLDGRFYDGLIPLAESMENENRHLAASMIYRNLLSSILQRGYPIYSMRIPKHLSLMD